MTTLHFLVSLFFLFSCFLPLVFSFHPPPNDLPEQCLDDQRSLLLQLQLQHDFYYGPNFTFSSKFELWDANTDCCWWEGVTCDALGHVIGQLSLIFNLHHLQHLNLAGNNFNTTLLSYGFDKLPNLTHLNLSSSCFHGHVPHGISLLTRLVSLDLSYQGDCYRRYYHFLNHSSLSYELEQPLKLKNPDFKTLIKNLKHVRELHLDGVDISMKLQFHEA
ncbi:hypothetical protein V6N13_050523 [Hibiscus sabdariffa]